MERVSRMALRSWLPGMAVTASTGRRRLVAVPEIGVVARDPLPHRLRDPGTDVVVEVDLLPVAQRLRRREAERGHPRRQVRPGIRGVEVDRGLELAVDLAQRLHRA